MTHTLPCHSVRTTTKLVRVRESRDTHELEVAMSLDRAYSAYALAQLDTPLFAQTRFWLGESDDNASGLVVHTRGNGRSMLLLGDPLVVRAILAMHPGPRFAYLATAMPKHFLALHPTHHTANQLTMCRMQVTTDSFHPATKAPKVGTAFPIRRLHGFDVPALNAFYRTGGGPSHYTPIDVERAPYWGAFEGPRLVAVAGTHVVAPERGVGVIGNVLTHPAYRSRGLATCVTSAVTTELFAQGVSLTALSVDPNNTPAIRAYRRLGYERGTSVVEAQLVRRSSIGVRAWWQRWRARRRAKLAHVPSDQLEEWIELRPHKQDGTHEGGAA